MKIRFIIFFCLLCTFGFSQKSSSIDLKIGGDLTFRNINSSESTATIDSMIDRRNEREKVAYNYNVGVLYNREISPALFFRTGVNLAVMGYETDLSSTFKYPNQHDGNGGHDPEIDIEPSLGIQYQHRYYFIEIPLLVRYEVGSGKLRPFIEGGFTPSYMVATKIIPNSDREISAILQPADITEPNRLNMGGSVAVGGNYEISSSFQLFAQGTYRHYLFTTSEADIMETLFAGGLEVGIRKSL